MPEPDKVECPDCKGEGMKKHCGWSVCLTCKGSGELTREEHEKYRKIRQATVDELMHPRSDVRE